MLNKTEDLDRCEYKSLQYYCLFLVYYIYESFNYFHNCVCLFDVLIELSQYYGSGREVCCAKD